MRLLVLALAALAALATPALAATSTPHEATSVTARLVTAEDVVTPEAGTVSAGLDLKLTDGWKTYWRTPGEVGFAPQLDWSASTNVQRVELLYPAPKRFTAFDIENYGYEDRVVYPLQVHLKEAGEPANLVLDGTVLVCADICIPETFRLTVDLPADAAAKIDTASATDIATFAEQVPATQGDITFLGAKAREDDIRVVATSSTPFTQPDVFVEWAGATFHAPRFELRDGGRTLIADMPFKNRGRIGQVKEAVFTVTDATGTDGARAVAGGWHPYASPSNALAAKLDEAEGGGELLGILALALLGGLILNLMPCVLPVLSIKLAGALQKRESGLRQVRFGFLWSGLGALAFTLALAGVLVGLRASGVAVGWGMQFQNPVFLVVVTGAIVLFAASMLDLIHLDLPASWNTRLAGVDGEGHAGDFLTGAFAALLATPCSAPFLGTAVAFALANGAVETFAVFGALGLGLAAPYLLVAARPSLIRLLPKPGNWMVWLRRVLALALVATAAWLATVLAAVIGWLAALAVLALVVAAVALMVVPGRMALRGGAIAAALVAALAVPALPFAQPPVASDAADHIWVTFDRGAIDAKVRDGEVVFVDVTADWCLTCKVNKRLVLSQTQIEARLAGEGVTAMVADWTRPDPAILAYLKANGRYGIPFNAVYGPGAPNGIVLSELLTREAVLEAIEKAGANPSAGAGGLSAWKGSRSN